MKATPDQTEKLRRIQQRVDTKNPLSKSQLIDLLREADRVITVQRSTILRLEKELQERPTKSGLISRIIGGRIGEA